ncbi:hypothetical protein KQI22_13085 [Kineothrix sp. MSJ-39]|uniref:hypothetical protein n=1 Tax=Kineothrix sp. MSJ-39 TaxID=2841533 RepID=UPI001C1160F2|nr:hypothetical protein [Kineothrix sp. MSJ-39]MBU5430984.1 hypothetical protein [Kineothrix sp. MSJ-39]
MLTIADKLNYMRTQIRSGKAKIMILGLGSVGNYLLDYLMSMGDENLEICVVGRDERKMEPDVNIVRVASMIRGQNRSKIRIAGNVNFENVSDITYAIQSFDPDIIVNSSRAYPGIKYGSISWPAIRAYGIWSPLAVHFTKNIMQAYELAGSKAIVINTSYSDAVIPWLKTAGMVYPDFGSGNINHLIPRIKFAVAEQLGIKDPFRIDVTFAVSHFHDVVISKEGHTENVSMLLDISYHGEKVTVDLDRVFADCAIAMPVDTKRNQMNASSNFEIIQAILNVVRNNSRVKLHCPGAFGEIGGYPIILDGTEDSIKAYISEDPFSLDEMRKKNRESIYLDGVEDIKDGILIYTDELLAKVKKKFGVTLVKQVPLKDADYVAEMIIREIIKKQN